jgi:outer membrane protein assembly factor BamD
VSLMMKIRLCALGAALVAAALLFGCSTVPDLGEATSEDLYDIGVQAAARGDYLVAIEAFRRITEDTPMSDLADDALIGLADAHRATGDYASAEAEYGDLLSDYPTSPLVPVAEFKLGVSYYDQSLPPALDQEMTRKAIAQLEHFKATYPGSDLVTEADRLLAELRSRLAEKEYKNALLYITLKDPEAARIYFETVALDYPETDWARKALLEEARSFRDEGATAKAAEVYLRLIDQYPDSAEAASAEAELKASGG